MKIVSLAFIALAAISLAGCNESAPEANAANCARPAFDKALNEIRREADKQTFIARCASFNKTLRLRSWEFKPSPKDDY
ncbi:TPA: entry exclusion lipoprotein TrbK [Pseudomonas aeruginosa]|uniref:entry exclusion lipoprotein TrbK n=1 Tax=Pseudomonas aeruginosa TaxID=287 RepID=UPI0009A297E1|nr:entry exclusion lipoprotein TrbK [Pseudomonas aeruginosa]HBO1237254.1 entry exclusion lipoprotein TrbK [Pseudomonas aeruginosa]HBO1875727.1 entry exclusion lipoprotein TrbK [Pseudomonas aeruginosa]HBO2079887.1 entry exclusion lipoprotein TrbK [Pseudomonas aeruginosa]HCH7472711.1 entry exclusion lipoprotein TrbK [Pseudomonas aeruginosa]HCH7802496.1 entry exclusion lipoprotein TrbK [Pseudomonas aeruginosa]